MKKLSTLFDEQLGHHYDLYQGKAEDITALVQNIYEKNGLSAFDMQRFNSASGLPNEYNPYERILIELNSIKKGLSRNYKWHEDKSKLDELEEKAETFKQLFFSGQIIGEKQEKSALFGYELMPLALSLPDKDINQMENVELLDGFRRIFYSTKRPKGDILIKVYNKLNDEDWFKSMIIFNSWKFADSKNPLHFLDRGFRLGLYYRFGIDFTDMSGYQSERIEENIRLYVNDKPYYSLWGNDQFVNDLRMIYEMKMDRPVFRHQKKRSEDVEDINDEKYEYNYPRFLEKIHEVFTSQMGRLRRMETQQRLKGNEIERFSFSFHQYREFMTREDLQEFFIKLARMSVPGHMDNFIDKHFMKEIKAALHPSLVDDNNNRQSFYRIDESHVDM